MRISIASPIPDLGSIPGPSRPGYPSGGSYEFQFEVTGAVTVKANAAGAGNFRISWPNGTTQVLSSNNASVAAPDGTAGIVSINNQKLDTTYADEFAVVSGKTNVTKVISWGSNAWSNLQDAFNGCTNLTHVEDTKLLAGSNCTLFNLFRDCTGLVSAICKKWDLSLANTINSMFRGCSNLEFLDFSGAKIGIQGGSLQAFSHIGTSTTNGCEFKFTGLQFTNLANHTTNYLFGFSKIKPSSSFANIKFPATEFTGQYQWFYSSEVTGTNSVLDCSGWTTFNGNLASFWARLNNPSAGASPTNTNLKVNLTNFSGKTSSINGFVRDSAISGIIGLSTWGATDGTAIDFTSAFHNARVFAMDASDNFSNTFISSCNVSGISSFYNQTGNDYNGTLVYGAAPNLTNLNCANITSFASIFNGAKLTSNPDFNSITYPSTAISFSSAFSEIRFQTYSGSHIDFSTATLKISSLSSAFRGYSTSIVEKLTFGDNVDFSQLTSFSLAFYNFGRGPGNAFPTEITLPTNADYSSVTSTSNMFFNTNFPYTTPALSTCQVDQFIRNLYSSRQSLGAGGALTINMPGMSVTAAPSLVRSTLDNLTTLGYNITLGSPDTVLPFAYANYAVDPTGLTTISPTTTPPAGSVFTATNSLNIDSSTGVITIGSFRGGSTIRCTYPDGCYNEVTMLIQVPFIMRTIIPANNTVGFELKPQMSAGECFVDWGDTNTQILTGNTTHVYASSASDQTYDISIFDSPNGSKFTGFTGNWAGGYGVIGSATYDKSIMQWGEIEWQNNSWFRGASTSSTSNTNKLRISAPNGAAYKPNLSQVTSLENMFFFNYSGGLNFVFEDVNNNCADWDVSTITNMSNMFHVGGAPSTRPSDGQPNTLQLSNWDVSNVTDFSGFGRGNAFSQSDKRPNGLGFDITNWNTAEATNFSSAFMNKGVITGLENLNTSKVTNMSNMFASRDTTYPDLKTKIVNGIVRWSVKKVTSFFSMFGGTYGGATFTNSTFPTNWWISGDGQDVNMAYMFGTNADNRGSFRSLTDVDAFATKTITSGSSPYGSSYTAWDMSKVTSLQNWAYSGQSANMSGKNWNIGTWQISNKCTNLQYMLASYVNSNVTYSIDQDLGHWDVTNVTAISQWMANFRPNRMNEITFSTANYDSLLDITDGWGQDAGSVQTGVTLNMGNSQYSPGNVVSVTWSPNNSSSGSNTLKTNGFNLQAATSVGDIIYYPASVGTTQTAYARITGYNSTEEATTTTTNWPTATGSARNFQIYDSNAAKGRFALVEAGWTITDGGAFIPFDSAEFTITTVNNNEVFKIWNHGMNAKIDWGDGNGFINDPNTGSPYTSTSPQFTYATPGTYTIKVMEAVGETFNGFRFGFGYQYGDQSGKRVQSLVNWGTSPVTSFSQAFDRSTNLTTLPVDASGYAATPSFSSATSMDGAFKETGLTTIDMRNWDPSTAPAVSNISNMFGGIAGFVGNGLDQWDVSNVTNMSSFVGHGYTANTVFNADITGWDTRNVTNFSYMFRNARAFNQNIGNWRTESATSLAGMFNGAYAFNQDINTKVVGSGASAYIAWDTSNNTTWSGMFMDAQAFNTSIDKWEIAQVSDNQGMCYMFGRTSVFNQDLLTKDVTIGTGTPVAKTYVAWDVSYIQTFGIQYNSPSIPSNHGMFEQNTVFNGDISNWDIPSTNARSDGRILNRMFTSATAFNKDLSQKSITNVTGKGNYNAWDVSSAIQINATFNGASSFDQNLSNWTLNSSATNFDNVFRSSNLSQNNYTDTIVGWANYVKNQNPDAPLNISMANQYGRSFESARSGGANFANAAAARNYLTDTVANGGAGWTISGDTVIPLPYNSFKIKLAVTSGTEKTISLQNTGTSYTIDWGDGTVETSQSGTVSHTYNPGNSGTTANPIVSIGAGGDSGPFTRMISSGGNANNPVLEVTQWGDVAWTSMAQMLQNNYNILITATDSPDLSNCVSTNSMFSNCQNTAICTNGSMNNWNVSNINNMAAMFNAATAMNVDISSWDVSSVIAFNGMFSYAYAFNSNISNWDVSSGQAFNQMLSHAYAFTADIGNWNVSSATNMREMFHNAGASSNTTQNLSVKVVNSGQANQYLAWYTPLCQNFQTMFKGSKYGKTNTDFQNWNVSSATTMRQMFDGYSGFNATTDMTPKSVTMGGITWNAWDTSSVTTFYGFAQNSNLSQDISGWNVSAATNLQLMTAATSVNYIFDWTALNSSLTTMNYIFGGTSMSTNNYTDSIVHFANLVKNQNPNAPLNVDMGNQVFRTFDSNRSGGSNFTNAFAAREFLTNATSSGGAGWTIAGDTVLPLNVSSTNSLSFNGSSEYINSYGSSSLNLTSALTVSMYIRVEDETNSGFRGLFTKGEINPYGYGSYSAAVINAQNNVRFYLSNAGPTVAPTTITTTSGLNFDQWYHVCFTYDGSLSSNKAKIYIDGVNQSVVLSPTNATIPSSLYSNTNSNFHIGAYYSTSYLFEGKIDEVMVWDNVISTSNITTLANAVGSGNVPDPNSLASGVKLWNRMGD